MIDCYAFSMNDTLANKVGALWATLDRRMEGVFGQLSSSSAAMLLTLSNWGAMSATEVGRIIGLSQPASARAVAKLVAAGLIERVEKSSGKDIGLSLTARGESYARKLRDRRIAACLELVERLSAGETAALDGMLTKILTRECATPQEARTLCRFCDHGTCRGGSCPVGSSADANHRGNGSAFDST